MRIPLLLFLVVILASAAQAQNDAVDSLDRRGKVWLDGAPSLNDNTEQFRAGYFFTDRFLVGGGLSVIGDGENYVSPFARVYLNDARHLLRPYAEAGVQVTVGRLGIPSSHFAVGLERAYHRTTLLNLESRLSSIDRDRQSYSFRASFNTVLGGAAWGTAASQQFRAGSFTLGNQLFEVAASFSDPFRSTVITVAPSLNYFLTDRLAAQARLDVAYTSFNQSFTAVNDDYLQFFTLNLRGGARYYLTTKSLFNVFFEGGLTYEERTVERWVTVGTDNSHTTQLWADLGVGTSVFINQTTSLDIGFNLNQDIRGARGRFADAFGGLKFWF